jgi:hypothetical protein
MEIPQLVADRLQDAFEPLSEADIRGLEQDLSVTFPDDFVAFLLKYNAAYAQHPLAFPVRNPGRFVEGGTLDWTLGIVHESPFSETAHNILGNFEALEGSIPLGLVPIANSGCDPICIAVSDRDYGRIYLWDSVEEGADFNTYLVADSFSEFLKVLYADDESFKYVENRPIFRAVERGETQRVHNYLSSGGEVEYPNEKGQTLLMCAARTRWPNFVRLLLERGAQPNSLDTEQHTPLYHAVIGQSNDSLKLLLAAGASAHFRDEDGRTLIELADQRAYYRIAHTLKKYLARC